MEQRGEGNTHKMITSQIMKGRMRTGQELRRPASKAPQQATATDTHLPAPEVPPLQHHQATARIGGHDQRYSERVSMHAGQRNNANAGDPRGQTSQP
jgi:hypothetical protein